jgi:hypothetical protein
MAVSKEQKYLFFVEMEVSRRAKLCYIASFMRHSFDMFVEQVSMYFLTFFNITGIL